MKTGILGGTFDPVHNAHLMIAGEAMKRLELDGVIFIPTSHTPLKEDDVITPVEHRVKMVELAIAGNPAFRLSRIEIDRAGISYTVDTITGLKQSLGDDSELYFITGLDSLGTLSRWKEPGRMIRMCRLVTVRRPGYDVPDINELEKVIPGITESLIILDGPAPDISATDIRKRAAAGLSISDLVPAMVEEYIVQNRLYTET
ncbi:MAG: nicotinate-nucleotide adenylyltransferase [Dehalococcoidales bacterium]|nr:MAG: nicotinate-nucleotide adenylyltransferase [Dehalococcoidales bacterium]